MTKRACICLRSIGNAAAFLFFALVAGGCAYPTYKPHSTAWFPKPDNYPIQVYTEEMKIPRPCELIGTVSFHAGKMTMFNGSSDKEMIRLLGIARHKGADALRLIGVEKPDFANPNYQLTAQLLHYADVWETIPFTQKTFMAYLAAHKGQLDPIEGIWLSDLPHGQTIGIMKDNSKPGRDFVAFILNSPNPTWLVGYKKMDIRRGAQTGTYDLVFYRDNFEPRELPIMLGGKETFSLSIFTSDEQEDISYAKFQWP